MTVVVTGGAGFIGANLVRRLEADHRTVVVIDDFSTGLTGNLDRTEATVWDGSILDSTLLDTVIADCTAVVHLAARSAVPRSLTNPQATHDVNVTGTVAVLEAARRAGGRHVIVASSSSVYGANPSLPKHEDLVPMPVSPYAASKLAAESYALAYSTSFDLDVLAFRFFNVYGPLQRSDHAYAAVVPAFVSAALRGDPLPIHGDGNQTRDFTFVDSVTDVIARAVEDRVTAPRPVNLAFGSRMSVLDLADELERVVGADLPRRHLDPRPGDVRESQADNQRLRALFPEASPTPLSEGLEATVDWYRASLSATPQG